MADIAWSAYALAMFTPEQRAAAVNVLPDDPVIRPVPIPPPGASAVQQTGLGIRITGPGIPPEGWDPNKPAEAAQIMALGWRFESGRWIAPGSLGTAATPDGILAGGGGGRVGLSSVSQAISIAGGSVLGTTVPTAPPVLLPSFVGGRLGVVRIGGGMRPESGGTPKRVVMGPGGGILPIVRMGSENWGR